MANRQKILLVSAGDFRSEYGGGQIYVKTIVDGLLDRGEEIVVAVRDDQGEPLQVSRYRQADVVSYAPGEAADAKGRVFALLDLVRPAVVHVHADKALFAAACRERGIPVIVTAHHGGILCPAGTLMDHRDAICRIPAGTHACLPCVLRALRWGRWAHAPLRLVPWRLQVSIGRLLRRVRFVPFLTPVMTAALHIEEKASEWEIIRNDASMLIAPSRAMAESMRRNGADDRKIAVVRHGIVPPALVRPSVKSPDGKLRFYFVGRICYVKGLHVLIRAFRSIPDSRLELHIIGGAVMKAEQRYLADLEKMSEPDSRIVWHGKVENRRLADLVAQFDVMVHPAIFLEVFGLTIAEAMASGKPVIATRCGGAEDQISDGETGVLVDANSVGSLRDGMLRLQADAGLRTKIAGKAPAAVIFIAEHVEALMARYGEVTSGTTR